MYSNSHGVPSIPIIACHNRPVYEIYDLELMCGFGVRGNEWHRFLAGICISLEDLCKFVYPGACQGIDINFFSVIKDFDKALQEEYELFCEQALPIFRRDYIPEDEYGFVGKIAHKKWEAAKEDIERSIQNWTESIEQRKKEMERSKELAEEWADLIPKHQKQIEAMEKNLERIVAGDGEYFEEKIQRIMEYAHTELNCISPRILRAWQAREE